MKKMILFLLCPFLLFSQTHKSVRLLTELGCTLYLKLQAFDNTSLVNEKRFQIKDELNDWKVDFNGGLWRVVVEVKKKKNGQFDIQCRTLLEEGKVSQTAVVLAAVFDPWSPDNYVLLPGAVYNGNRFHSLPMPYPPLMSDPVYFRTDFDLTISNVPRLNIEKGPSKIEQTTGDPSTPAMGFFSASRQKSYWLLTEQATQFGNSGLTVEENAERTQCSFSVTAPSMREKRQTMVNQAPSDDRAPDWSTGDSLTLCVSLYVDPADKIQDLFDKFIEIRKNLTGPTQFKQQLPFRAAFDIQQKKYNEQNWEDSRGYYSVGMRENMAQDWQLGWVGGLMATLPFLTIGDSLSFSRACQNIETIVTKSQAASGFFYGIGDGANWFGDGFSTPHPHNMHMVRKSADALYYLAKQFLLLEAKNPDWQCPDHWRQALLKLADAFVELWNRYGQFGQFVDVETGELLIGGSTAGAMAPGGLALTAHYLKEEKYLRVAEKAAQFYYDRDVKNGLTTGGPGEILQNPDSESAFSLLESFVVLYDITGKAKYKAMARDMAKQCASWVVSYDYTFPDSSLFGRLDIKSAGAVIANVQNKHGAPGICTLSGNSLLKLYRATQDTFYLDLLRDIAHNITQYLSRVDRPVGDMPPGWMNERVNLSDWEGLDKVGDIFYGSTWAEVACLLTATEIPSIYIQRGDWKVWTFDHVKVQVLKKGRTKIDMLIENPTQFTAVYSLFIEDDKDLTKNLDPVYFANFDSLRLAPAESRRITITFKNKKEDEKTIELPMPMYRKDRLPRKTSAFISPGYYWLPDEPDATFYSLDMQTRSTTLYKPSPANFRLGLTLCLGINAIVAVENQHVGLAPLPYVGLGPEVRLVKSLYIYPHVASIAFPFTLFNDSWRYLTYGAVDVGVRIPTFNFGIFYISYGAKVLGEWFDTDDFDTLYVTNLSLGFEFK